MKTIEQKAKAYDEAMKNLRTMRDAWNNLETDYSPKDVVHDIEYYFPELAESEDEMICRKLIAFLKQCKGVYGDSFKQFDLNIDDAIAWLEKRAEQKHQYNSRPKYVREEELLGTNKQGKCPFLKQELIDKGFAFTQDGDLAYPIHKIEKKEFTAWSEEDEKMLDGIIEASTHHCYLNITDINWLKSLKERYTWKPSKEQIKAVKLARSFVVDDLDEHPSLSEILIELEEQLKKLNG